MPDLRDQFEGIIQTTDAAQSKSGAFRTGQLSLYKLLFARAQSMQSQRVLAVPAPGFQTISYL
jgi:hypothetical protein